MSAWKSLLSKNLRELRFIMCYKSAGSKGVREYLYKNYHELKTANPLFPIYVRECEAVEPNILARYSKAILTLC